MEFLSNVGLVLLFVLAVLAWAVTGIGVRDWHDSYFWAKREYAALAIVFSIAVASTAGFLSAV